MVTVNEIGREELSEILVDDDEDHDGWGPIRPRRSSMPPHAHVELSERDTLPAAAICAPQRSEPPSRR